MGGGFLRSRSYLQFSLLQSDIRIYRKVELLNGVIKKSWMCSSRGGFPGSNGEPAEVSFAVQYLPNPGSRCFDSTLSFYYNSWVMSAVRKGIRSGEGEYR